MILEIYQSDDGRTMCKLDGKRISRQKADEIVFGNNDVQIIDNTTSASYGDWARLLEATPPSTAHNNTITPQDVKALAASNSRLAAFNTDFYNFKLIYPDRLTAINAIEEFLPAFVIDSSVKILGGIFARNSAGDEMTLYDDSISLKVTRDGNTSVTLFKIDIPESDFIARLNEVTLDAAQKAEDVGVFTITGNSGTIYTFSERSLEVVASSSPDDVIVTVPSQPTTDENLLSAFVSSRRRILQYHNIHNVVHHGVAQVILMFKLYFPSGKTFLTHVFGDPSFTDCFGVTGSSIFFAVDTTIKVADYSNIDRAYEVYDAIVNAYNSHHSFTLPKD